MRSKLGLLPYVILLLPFDIAIAVGILAVHLCIFVPLWFKKHNEHKDPNTQRPNPVAAIIIVNWDGKHFLAECLPEWLALAPHTNDTSHSSSNGNVH